MSGEGFGIVVVGQEHINALLKGYQQPQIDEKMQVGLSAFGRSLSGSVRRHAPPSVRAGVRPGFKKGGRHRAGDLYRSIKSKKLRGMPRAIVVGPMSGMRHLAIRATRAHDITSVHGWLWAGNQYTQVVHHPGNQAHPWVDQGIRAGRDEAKAKAASAIFRAVLLDPASGGDD